MTTATANSGCHFCWEQPAVVDHVETPYGAVDLSRRCLSDVRQKQKSRSRTDRPFHLQPFSEKGNRYEQLTRTQ